MNELGVLTLNFSCPNTESVDKLTQYLKTTNLEPTRVFVGEILQTEPSVLHKIQLIIEYPIENPAQEYEFKFVDQILYKRFEKLGGPVFHEIQKLLGNIVS